MVYYFQWFALNKNWRFLSLCSCLWALCIIQSSANNSSRTVFNWVFVWVLSRTIANILPPSLNQSWMPLFVSFWCISCSTTAKKMLKNKQTALHPCLSPCLNMKGLEQFFYSTKFCNLPLHKAFKILTAHWHSGWMFIVSQYL